MSKQANPTIIGAFVVGAAALLAVGAALFGGSELFKERYAFVAFFEEQTKGLKIGSNVVANGVRVGYVSEVALLIDEDTYQTLTRVTLEILPDAYVPVRSGRPIADDEERMLGYQELVDEAGLRAQLEIESIITGQLLVKLERRPDTSPVMRGVDSDYPEIPTIPSDIQEIIARIENWAMDLRESVDVGELTTNLNGALKGIADLASSEDLHNSLDALNRLLNQIQTRSLTTNANYTLADIGIAAESISQILERTDASITDISGDLQLILDSLDSTLHDATTALELANRQLRGDSEQAYQVQTTFREVERAAKAMRDFFDALERNPEAFLKGRQEQQ
jgi:paraquat-inducible protein B